MKKLTLLILLNALFVGNIFSEPLPEETTLFCQIKDQQILDIEEGIVERYSRYTDGAENGETVRIVVTHGLRKFNVRTKENKAMTVVSGPYSDTYSDPHNKEITRGVTDYSVYAVQAEIKLNEDRMTIVSNTLNRFFFFERYYKNDWQLRFSDAYSGYTAVANCMNQTGFQRILKYYDKYSKK